MMRFQKTIKWYFDQKTLFISVPLEHTIDITIKRIYQEQETIRVFTKLEMKKLLILRTKKVNFSCDIKYYIAILYSNWRDRDGFTFGPSNNQHMVEPESIFVTNLDDHIKLEIFCPWYLSIYQAWLIEYVLTVLNSFHDNIKFAYEQDKNIV